MVLPRRNGSQLLFHTNAPKRNDQTENGNFEETHQNMLAFETLLSKHKDLIIYAEHSAIDLNCGTDQDKYHTYCIS